jgi:hypothetical protein
MQCKRRRTEVVKKLTTYLGRYAYCLDQSKPLLLCKAGVQPYEHDACRCRCQLLNGLHANTHQLIGYKLKLNQLVALILAEHFVYVSFF